MDEIYEVKTMSVDLPIKEFIFMRDTREWREYYRNFNKELYYRFYFNSKKLIIYEYKNYYDRVSLMDVKFNGNCPDFEILVYIEKLIL